MSPIISRCLQLLNPTKCQAFLPWIWSLQHPPGQSLPFSGRTASTLTICFADTVNILYINMTKSADIDPLLMEGNASPLQHTFSPGEPSSYLAKLWAEIRNEVRHDLKSTRWRQTAVSYFKWLGFSIWALGLIVLCVIFPLVITPSISLESSEYWNYCAPDGSFSLDPTNPWNPDWTFQIVLAFGSLSFTQAKVIDIVWDIVSSNKFSISIYALYEC